MATSSTITGLILAGGAGRRVGHRDKGLICWRGKPLVAHVADSLRPQVNGLIVSCNRNMWRYREFAPTVLPDRRNGYQGPLAGLEAAAACIATDYVAIAPCDTPLLPSDLVKRLLTALTVSESANISYAHDGHRSQYLCAMIRRHCLTTLGAFLDDDHRAVKAWYRQHACVVVDFSDCATSFRNYNSLAELSGTKTP